jgi:large subunit ribosomal protein L23
MNKYQVIKRPLVTERSVDMAEEGIYSFEVDRDANKLEIREAIEAIFKVSVVGVNTLRVHRKQRGRGRFAGYTQVSKKAIVRLKPGDKIDIFESA